MKHGFRFIVVGFLIFTCLGFRTSRFRWDISRAKPTVWLDFCDDMEDYEFPANDLKAGDPFEGNDNYTFGEMVGSVMDDFDNVPHAFIRFARVPSDKNNPGTPQTDEETWSESEAKDRTITICGDKPSTNA